MKMLIYLLAISTLSLQARSQNNARFSFSDTQFRVGSTHVLQAIDFHNCLEQQSDNCLLDSLTRFLLKHEELSIRLEVHTDSRGGDSYNLNLTGDRAEKLKDQLIEAGISKQRIKTRGMGETKPLNHCVDGIRCSEEEHQENRRTVVRIIKIEKEDSR